MADTSPGQERLRQMLDDARSIVAWLDCRHPGLQITLCVAWARQVQQVRHITALGDTARPYPAMTAEAVRAMAALGWTRSRVRSAVVFAVRATDLPSCHQRLAAVARIEETLRRP